MKTTFIKVTTLKGNVVYINVNYIVKYNRNTSRDNACTVIYYDYKHQGSVYDSSIVVKDTIEEITEQINNS